jgi:pimeloyl-ACP methyl ester carboxylesterase
MSGREFDWTEGGIILRVRDAGAPDGFPIIHFHGTPGGRLEQAWADDVVAAEGVRLITFDRPGYGGSTEVPFSLRSVADLALALADHLELGRICTMGLSGGGPFALACAALAPDRVAAVGVASGAGPFQEIPSALDQLSDLDKEAVAYLPGDRPAAAATFGAGFEKFRDIATVEALQETFAPVLSARDKVIVGDPVLGPHLLAEMREALRPGVMGGGWDNVAWVGAWDVDLDAIRAPVLLWYADEDLMAPLPDARWLEAHLQTSTLSVRHGEGHFGIFEHMAEYLQALKAAAGA